MVTKSYRLFVLVFFLFASGVFAETSAAHLWVTDVGGQHVYIYEVGSWGLVGKLDVGFQAHGICTTSDGRVAFISVEGTQELVRIDAATRRITGRVTVGPIPNEIECTADGRYVYVPCADGRWWIVDGQEMKVIGKIHTRGRPHNTLISPDQRFMFLAPLHPACEVTIVDIQEHEVAGAIEFTAAPRPGAISADGTLLFQQVDGLLGFEVASVESGRLLNRVRHQIDEEKRNVKSRCHGLALRSDQEEIWSANVNHQSIHIHELASGEFHEVKAVDLPGRPYWISFSKDGTLAFVSLLRDEAGLQTPRVLGKCFAVARALGFVFLPLWFRRRKNNSHAFGQRIVWAFALWVLFCWLVTLGLFFHVKSESGKIAVFDADTKKIITYLDGGRTPKRTQVIESPNSNPSGIN